MAATEINEYLICLDFDQTIANTFEKSPNKIGVLEAYKFAILSVLGEDGLKIYEQNGGLKNRAPSEIVEDLLNNGNKELLLRNAKSFFRSKEVWLRNLTSQGKFIIPEWNEKYSDKDTEDVISEMIILLKLFHLKKEIGTSFPDGRIWPEPCKGILDFFQTVNRINADGKVFIQLAILSSGHTEFVQKTFNAWNIECHDILLTDDDVRKLPIEMKDKVKPSRFLFSLIYSEWLKKHGINSIMPEIRKEDRPNILYIGDDLNKDGKLAEITGILFGWFNPNNEKNNKSKKDMFFSFEDWNVITRLLKHEKPLNKGESLVKIFSPLILQH